MARKLWIWALVGAVTLLNVLPGVAQAGVIWGS
jgi:hypothetical protein